MSNRLEAVKRLPRENRQRGFVLFELVLTAVFLISMSTDIFVSINSLQRYCYKNQLRLAADMLAADIRGVQQDTMFSPEQATKTLNVNNDDRLSYSIYTDRVSPNLYKKVIFADCGYNNVYFSQYLSSVSFYKNGSPMTNGTYQLRHKKLPNFYCKLSLQPVTGRVTVTEYGS